MENLRGLAAFACVCRRMHGNADARITPRYRLAMRTVLVVAIAAIGCGPLAPGETKCTTTNVYGTAITKCKSGPPIQAEQPVQQPPVVPTTWWCTSLGEVGACVKEPSRCEQMRAAATERLCAGKAPGGCIGFGACVEQQRVVCSATACFPTPRSCLDAEVSAGNDGSSCKAR